MSDLSLHFYFLLGLSICLLSLALSLINRYQKLPAIQYYAGFLGALSSIALTQAILFLPLPNQILLLLTRLGYVFGALTFSMLLMFSFHFLIPSKKMLRSSKLLWVIPVVFFVPFVLFNPFFVQSVSQVNNGILESNGVVFFIFPLFVGSYAIWSIVNLLQKFPYLHPGQQKDMKLFIVMLVIAILFGVVFDVMLPATGHQRIPVGIYSSSILFGISAYIVMKK